MKDLDVAEYKGAVREAMQYGSPGGTCFRDIDRKEKMGDGGGGRGLSLRAQEDRMPVKTERAFPTGAGRRQCKQKDKAKNNRRPTR